MTRETARRQVAAKGRGRERHVLAYGYVGEWNVDGLRHGEGQFAVRQRLGYSMQLTGSVFKRAKDILGAKRRKGLRAIRVRVVLEVL